MFVAPIVRPERPATFCKLTDTEGLFVPAPRSPCRVSSSVASALLSRMTKVGSASMAFLARTS